MQQLMLNHSSSKYTDDSQVDVCEISLALSPVLSSVVFTSSEKVAIVDADLATV